MKKILIPLINQELTLHIGHKSWPSFKEQIEFAGLRDPCCGEAPSSIDGLCIGNDIWISNPEDIRAVYHEVFHAIDLLFDYLQCGTEKEFKAWLIAHVFSEVHVWINGLKEEDLECMR